jgi:hypothetical protein
MMNTGEADGCRTESATFSKPSRDVAIGQSVDEVAAIIEQNTHVCYSPSLSSLSFPGVASPSSESQSRRMSLSCSVSMRLGLPICYST